MSSRQHIMYYCKVFGNSFNYFGKIAKLSVHTLSCKGNIKYDRKKIIFVNLTVSMDSNWQKAIDRSRK